MTIPKFARGDRVHIEGPLNTDGTIANESPSWAQWWSVRLDDGRHLARYESELTLIPPAPKPVTIELDDLEQISYPARDLIVNGEAVATVWVDEDGCVYVGATCIGTVPR